MRRITVRETVLDILALLGQVTLRLGQAATVTAAVVLVLAVVSVKRMCGCSTKEKAYQASMKSDLRNLMTAQEEYYREHAAYAGSTAALGEDQYWPSAGVSIVIEGVTASGWRATTTHTSTPKRCGIFVGDVAPPPVKDAVEGEPRCWDPP